MDPQPLNIRVDSKQAQADLAALARALDTAGNSSTLFQQKFTQGMHGADTAVKGATQALGKFAQVAALVSKIRISDDPAKQLKMLTSALNQLGKVGANIKGATSAMGQFAEVASLVDRIKLNPANIKHLAEFSQAIAQVSKTRGPSTNSLKGLVNFIEVASRAQQLKFNPAMAANLRAFAAAMDSIGRARIITASRVSNLKELFVVLQSLKAPNGSQKLQSLFSTLASIKVPSEKAIGRIKMLFDTLAQAKAIPGASKIAHDLDTIAAAANRAGAALNSMPKTVRGINPAFQQVTTHSGKLKQTLSEIPEKAGKAHASFGMLGKGLGELDHRFNLAYQASTLFSQFFAAFTVGEFLRGLYDANIQLLKLQKALVFSTGSFAGAERATDTYIGIANDLGLSLAKTTEAYSKFTLAAKSSGLDLQKSNDIYKSIGTALQVVGASSQQTELAFYGLQQMIQKGKVSAEEFNRQIGEQIPGNAVLGARALSKLEGHVVTVGDFFKQMSQGQIMSAQFVPAYAEEVRKQFEPLVKLAQERPDAALNRLTNSFFVFARAVGKGGVMTALTTEFDRLSAKIMYTDDAGTHLTPQFQKLADSMGRGLASAVHILGDGISFLADHLNEVMAIMKTFLAIRVGATFAEWGKGALSLGASIGGLAKNIGGAVTAALATAPAKAAVAATEAVPEAASIGALATGQATRSIVGRRSLGEIRTVTKNEGLRSRLGRMFAAVTGNMGADITPLRNPTLNRASDYEEAFSTITPMGARRMASESRQNWLTRYRASARVGANAFERPGARGEIATAASNFVPLFGAGAKAAKTAGTVGAAAEELVSVEKAATKSSSAVKLLGGALKLAGSGAATFATGGLNKLIPGLLKATKGGFNFAGLLGKLAPMLGLGLVGALAAGGIALAAFGNNTTKVQGKTMRFNDIVLGGLTVLKKGFTDWWDKAKPNFKFFTDAMDGLGKNSGDIVASIVAGFVTLGKIIGRVFAGIGEIIGEFIKHSPLATFVRIVASVAKGDFKGAGDILGESTKSGFGLFKSASIVADVVKGSASDIKDFGKTKQQVIDAGAGIAAARDQKIANDKAIDSQHAYIESTLAAAQATDAAAEKMGELDNLNRQIALGSLGTPSASDLIKQAQAAQANDVNLPTASAATVAGVGSVSNDVKKGASQQVQDAIDAAASKYGVSADYLYRTAKRESSFNTNAKAATSSAGGLFQFTDATAKAYGLTNRFDANQSADAAARLTAQNAKYLESKTGHTATEAELYAAHFLGPRDAATLIQTALKSPTSTGAELFPNAAKANRSIFYNKDENGRYTEAKTAAQILNNLGATFGGADATGAAGAAGMQVTPGSEQSLTTKYHNAAETYNGLIARNASPSVSAQADYDKYKHDIQELLDLQTQLQKQGLHTFVDPKALADAMEKANKELTQAINPFLKINEEMDNGNKVLELRAKGLTDAADFQERLNGFVEQGYKATELDTKANRDAYQAQKDRNDLLQSQIDLTSELNNLAVARAGRNSPRDAYIASHIKIDPGQSYADALQSAKDSGAYANIAKAADANQAQNTAFAKDDLRVQLSEMQATQHLSASAKGYRDDFKSYLQELSGISTGTLDEIEKKAGPDLVALAKHAADVKYAIDNAPGFKKWADQLEPLAKRLNDLKGEFADGLTDNIASALNGDKVDWSSFFKDFRKQVIKAQVQDVFKGLFGSKSNALMSPDEKIKASADATSMAASDTAQAASGLSGAATTLSSAGDSLTSAAQAIMQACSGAANAVSSDYAGGTGSSSNGLGLTNLASNFIPASQMSSPTLTAASPVLPSLLGAASGLAASDGMGMGVVGQGDPDPTVTVTGHKLPFIPALNANDFIPASQMASPTLTTDMPTLPTLSSNSGGGILSSIGNFITKPQSGFSGLLKTAGLTGLLTLLSHKKKKKPYIEHAINGVIGQYGGTTMSGTEVAAHSNAIGDLLSFGVGMLGANGFGAPGGNLTNALGFGSKAGIAAGSAAMSAASSAGTNNFGGWLKRAFAGFFSEGGYATQPVSGASMSMAAFANAPHYKEGTPNTSGIPAVLHPNEAVVPLTRNRAIPIEGDFGGGGTTNHFTTNMTIVTPNADSFRKSQSSIQREQSQSQRRSSLRNLNGG